MCPKNFSSPPQVQMTATPVNKLLTMCTYLVKGLHRATKLYTRNGVEFKVFVLRRAQFFTVRDLHANSIKYIILFVNCIFLFVCQSSAGHTHCVRPYTFPKTMFFTCFFFPLYSFQNRSEPWRIHWVLFCIWSDIELVSVTWTHTHHTYTHKHTHTLT